MSAGEARARAEVAERAAGSCEVTGAPGALEWAHRVSLGRGGAWTPWNGLHLSRAAHAWCHQHPGSAYAAGWFVETGHDPAAVPVWLARPYPGWWLLQPAEDGGKHVAVPLDPAAAGLPERPALMPGPITLTA